MVQIISAHAEKHRYSLLLPWSIELPRRKLGFLESIHAGNFAESEGCMHFTVIPRLSAALSYPGGVLRDNISLHPFSFVVGLLRAHVTDAV